MQKQSQRDLPVLELDKNGNNTLSIFVGEKASDAQIAVTIKKLATAFPDMKEGFYNLLTEQIAKSNFTAGRLKYALDNLLNNFHYKQLTIADLMSADVKCRVYNYYEMCDEAWKNGGSTGGYAKIYFGNAEMPHWILKIDKERYHLPERL